MSLKKATDNSIAVKEVNVKGVWRITRNFTLENIDTLSAIRGTIFPNSIDIKSRKNNLNQTIISGALIAAAINWGVLYNTAFWNDRINDDKDFTFYYQPNNDNFGQFNPYSKILHEHSIEHQCFGFCYDQLFQKGSQIEILKKSEAAANLKITLLPFK